MKTLGLLFFLALSHQSFSATDNTHSRFAGKILTQLGTSESFLAQTIQANLLWVGSSRGDNGTENELIVYDMTGREIHRRQLNHTISEIFPYKNDTVVITGNSWVNTRRHGMQTETTATFLKWDGHRVVTSLIMPWPSPREDLYFTSHGDAMFWGSNGGDEFATSGSSKITGLQMVDKNHVTTLLNSSEEISRNLYVQNLDTGTSDALLPDGDFKRAYELIQTSDSTVTTADFDEGRIIVGNFVNKTAATYPAQVSTPRSLATLGRCLVVASQKARQIAFLDQTKNYELVDLWDLSEETKTLRGFKKISVDANSGQIFIRSAFPISFGTEINAVISIKETSSNTFNKCLAAKN